jgi:hypothetical protein
VRMMQPSTVVSLTYLQGIIALSTAISCSSISRSPWFWRAICASTDYVL